MRTLNFFFIIIPWNFIRKKKSKKVIFLYFGTRKKKEYKIILLFDCNSKERKTKFPMNVLSLPF